MSSLSHGRRIRVAAVGLGWVTTHRHLPTMFRNRLYDVVGVVDRNPDRVREVTQKRRGLLSSCETDLARINWLQDVDAVTIGTSPFTHYQLIKAALVQGKHVLTEKPFAMSVEEGEDLVSLARQNSLILAIVHNFQFATSTRKLIRDIDSGRYGRLRGILATQLGNPLRRLPVWYQDLPLGLFYDESPHLLYLLSRLAPGSLRLIRSDSFASTTANTTPAAISAQYSCSAQDGIEIPVTMQLFFESPLSEWHVTVLGERALGDIDVFRDIYIRLPNDGAHSTRTVFRTSEATTLQHWGQHLTSGIAHLLGVLDYGNGEVFLRFAEAVLAGREPAAIGPDDALRVLRMQHEIVAQTRMS